MLQALGLVLARTLGRWMPDPFVLAILLSVATAALALAWTDVTPAALLDAWAGERGIFSLLRFAMQMCLMLVTGHAVAHSPPLLHLARRLAAVPRTGAQAVYLVALVTCSAALLHWGLGLILGAMAARLVGAALAARGVKVHYPLLCAAGYLGMMVWHGGLSGSAPLKVTQVRDIVEVFGEPAPFAPIGLERTLFAPLNLWITLGLVVLLPFLAALLMPRRPELCVEATEYGVREEADAGPEPAVACGPRPWLVRVLEESPLVSLLLGVPIAVWAWRLYAQGHGGGVLGLTPDALNLTMLLVGLLLHRTPLAYLRAVERAAPSCAGILLSFPLYGGILGMMAESGLTARLAGLAGATLGAELLPAGTFVVACGINLFVPSGGGQWAVQGPIAVRAALDAGVDPARIVMAVAYGDQLTNMLQPFWALPLLAITRVRVGDLIGYSALLMLCGGAWIGLLLLLA